MIRTSSLYEACHKLFADYPLAARAIGHGGTIRSMILMLQDGDDAGFFILSHDGSKGSSPYSLCPWPAGGIVDIEADSGATVPDVAVNAMTRGIPIPRDGSLFGWTCGDAIAALVVIYAEYAPEYPEPGWSVMPLAGSPEARWPPFTGERLFGYWSWEHVLNGRMVSLDGLIAGSPNTVFWTDTKATIGSDCCAVERDIRSPEGHTLRRGCYAYYQALQASKPVPPLMALLADSGKIDLAPRFWRSAHSDG